jgi:transposase-like protein
VAASRPARFGWGLVRSKVKGRKTYLYRAVDKEGKTVDSLLRAKRDVAAAKAFFRQAFRRQGRLQGKITLDGYQASHLGLGNSSANTGAASGPKFCPRNI